MGNSDKYERIVKDLKTSVMIATYGPGAEGRKDEKVSPARRKEKNPVTWWDADCHQVTEERKKKHKEWIKNPTLENHIEYKRVNAIARKTIRRKKKESFISFVSSLNRKSNIKYVWNKMRTIKNSFNTIDWRK